MTAILDNIPVFVFLVLAALGSLYLIVRLLLQPLAVRLRILKHMDSDGARLAALEDRVQRLRGCLGLVQEIRTADTEEALVDVLIREPARILRADRFAIAWGSETWVSSRSDGSEQEQELDQRLHRRLDELRSGAPPPPEEPLTVAEPIPMGTGRDMAWLAAVRGSVPFAPELHSVLPSLGTVVGLGLNRLEWLRAGTEARERSEHFQDLTKQAERVLERSERLGLQGQLTHHLVRELTGPLTGVLGLAQFLARSADLDFGEEIHLLLEEALRCRHILEQFAAVSLADAGQEIREIVDAAQVLREVLEATAPRFRSKGVVQRCGVPSRSVLINANPVTLSRLLTDVALAGLASSDRGGEVLLELQLFDETLRIDCRATCHPEASTAEVQEPPQAPQTTMGLWHDLETMNLAVLEAMCHCLGGELELASDAASLLLRLRLPAGQTALPLHAGLLASYRAETETPYDGSDGGRGLVESPHPSRVTNLHP